MATERCEIEGCGKEYIPGKTGARFQKKTPMCAMHLHRAYRESKNLHVPGAVRGDGSKTEQITIHVSPELKARAQKLVGGDGKLSGWGAELIEAVVLASEAEAKGQKGSTSKRARTK